MNVAEVAGDGKLADVSAISQELAKVMEKERVEGEKERVAREKEREEKERAKKKEKEKERVKKDHNADQGVCVWVGSGGGIGSYWKLVAMLLGSCHSVLHYKGVPLVPQCPDEGVPLVPQCPDEGVPLVPQYPDEGVPLVPQCPDKGVPLVPQCPNEGVPLVPQRESHWYHSALTRESHWHHSALTRESHWYHSALTRESHWYHSALTKESCPDKEVAGTTVLFPGSYLCFGRKRRGVSIAHDWRVRSASPVFSAIFDTYVRMYVRIWMIFSVN
jgi:hypothetical protein